MADEKTITQMLDEYNTLGQKRLVEQFGAKFRPRASFKDKTDAVKSLAKLNETIKASEEGYKAQEAQKEPPAGLIAEIPPGLKRLREDKRAEEIRQATLADQKQASENAKEEREKMATNGTKAKSKAKAVKSKTPAKARGRKGQFTETQKIHMIVKENPRREGTGVYKQFELAKKSPTVGAYVKAGGSLGSLRKGVLRKWLRVE